MKKLTQIALVAIIAVLFASCKKDYTCTCTYVYPGSAAETTSVTIHNTKSKAKTACDNIQTVYSFGGVFVAGESYTCSLK